MKREQIIKILEKYQARDSIFKDKKFVWADDFGFIADAILTSHPEPAQEQEKQKADEIVTFKAKRIDNGNWITGFFCKYQFHKGGLFVPCIQVLKEWDEGDYLEYYEIIPETLRYASQSQSLPSVLPSVDQWIEKEMPINVDDDDMDKKVNKWCRKAVRLYAQYVESQLKKGE
jgi:hypothetical protein